MRKSVYGCIKITAIFIVTLVGFGCATIPQKEFRSYSDSFNEVKSATELLLLEYDTAKRVENEYKASKTPDPTSGMPYPSEVNLNIESGNLSATDHIGVRREALEVVSNFNTILISLAEGKKPEEIKSKVDSLIGGIKNVTKLFGTEIPIPYAGEIASLVSTVIAKLEEAHNRQQFKDALREAEPLVVGILHLFARDAEDIYKIRALQTDRLWTAHQRAVATLVWQMSAVAKEHAQPMGGEASKLQKIEKDVREVLDQAGLKKNTSKLPATGTREFSAITSSQLEQTLKQARAEADKYEAVIKTQNKLYQLGNGGRS